MFESLVEILLVSSNSSDLITLGGMSQLSPPNFGLIIADCIDGMAQTITQKWAKKCCRDTIQTTLASGAVVYLLSVG